MLFSLLNYPVKNARRLMSLVFPFFLLILPIQIFGQPPIAVTEELMREVFPDADRFSSKEGEPPVYRALRESPENPEPQTIGYLFETPDMPPEEVGYSAPVDILVGMDLHMIPNLIVMNRLLLQTAVCQLLQNQILFRELHSVVFLILR